MPGSHVQSVQNGHYDRLEAFYHRYLWVYRGQPNQGNDTFAKVALWNRATISTLIFAGPGIPESQRVDAPVELFSIYPILTDLAKLPNPQHMETKSIYPLLKYPKGKWEPPAITTWARNNHAIVTNEYRYIRYEDGTEELYDLMQDPDEWYNQASEDTYAPVKAELRKLLPKTNVKWAEASRYDNNDYFRNQKIRDSQ